MIRKFLRRRRELPHLDPDAIFLDTKESSGFDEQQFEGRLEKPISRHIPKILSFAFILVIFIFLGKVISLQIFAGEKYRQISENNRLDHTLIFSNRGLIYDRNNKLLAWNEKSEENQDYNNRMYIEIPGFDNLIGYISYPKKDKKGFYFDTALTGKDGVEKFYDSVLQGQNGVKLVEVDALGEVTSSSAVDAPVDGDNIVLTIDADIQSKLYSYLEEVAKEKGFVGGGGVIMDVMTGDIIALASYPSYDATVMSEAKDKDIIGAYQNDSRQPFLNRVIDGLYTPGSIMKPFIAMGALTEGIITPERQILSEGEMLVPNPYNPDNPTYFSDWKAHGLVDMRRALAVSSNIYFYQVGGGYGSQKGLGIANIEKYYRLFV